MTLTDIEFELLYYSILDKFSKAEMEPVNE